MAPPPSTNLPPRNSFLHASSNWKSKSCKNRRKRNPNLNPNLNQSLSHSLNQSLNQSGNHSLNHSLNLNDPNINIRKKPKRNLGWTSDHGHGQVYQPPRLKDLQFQNRIKASRFFPKRFNKRAAPAVPFVDNSASGYGSTAPVQPFLPPRQFPAETVSSGFPIDGKSSSLNVSASRSHIFAETEPGLPHSVMVGDGNCKMGQNGPQFAGNTEPSMISRQNFGPGTLDFAPVANTKPDHSSLRLPGKGDVVGSGHCTTGSRIPNNNVMKQYKRRKPFRRDTPAPIRGPQHAPAAPRNTTSFLMRAKKSGGITSLISPSPTTPVVVPTPVRSPFPPFRGLADEANQEWGVNGYGSMNGLIRLRSSEFERDDAESEVEQGAQSAQQLEERLDHDVSRFVMTYPSNNSQSIGQNLLEIRMDDQESHIAHLEEENMDLKERLHLMQREVEDLRRRMHVLEGFGNSNEDDEAEGSTGRSIADDVSCL